MLTEQEILDAVSGADVAHIPCKFEVWLSDLHKIIDALDDCECSDEVFWSQRRCYVPLNDVFHWAVSDVEDLAASNAADFVQAHQDCKEAKAYGFGSMLFACRVRKMRPQGAYYKHIPREVWPLFDACGPERPAGPLNPVGTDKIEEYTSRNQ